MKIFNLPDDIFLDKKILDSSIIIHHYTANADSFKERSILNRNAISLVINGQKTMHFAEKTVYTNDKEIHFLSAANCIASMDISRNKIFESILIFFDDKELTDFYISNSAFIDKVSNSHKLPAQPYIAFEKDNFINNYILSLLLILKSSTPFSLQMKRLKLQELLLYLLENRPAALLRFQNKKTLFDYELTIRKAVESNLSSNLTLDEIAFLCNVSTSTFKRQFKKIYDASPNEWLLEQRMKLAAQMLTKHKEKPGEIWFKLGFETHSGFTRSFKKHFGVAPKNYAPI